MMPARPQRPQRRPWAGLIPVIALALACMSPPTIAAGSKHRCSSPGVPQAWKIENASRTGQGARILMRRQSSKQGGRLTELKIKLPTEFGEDVSIIYGDRSSPYLYLLLAPTEEPIDSIHLMVLCRNNYEEQPPDIIAQHRIAIDFDYLPDDLIVAEEPGEGVVFSIGDQHALLWRNQKTEGPDTAAQEARVDLLQWPQSIRALSIHTGDALRISALLTDGSLWGRRAAHDAPMREAPRLVNGWPVDQAKPMLSSFGQIWLQDTGPALFALAGRSGLRALWKRPPPKGQPAPLALADTIRLYGDNDERLAGWDRFYSNDGQRTALLLLLASKDGADGWGYRMQILDLGGQSISEPVMTVQVPDGLLRSDALERPVILLQAWDQRFEHMTGYLFHNSGRGGVVDAIELLEVWDKDSRTMMPRLLVDRSQRKAFGADVFAEQVSVYFDNRRRQVFSAAGEGYSARFDDPIDIMLNETDSR
jgi:hypothetical protein